MVTLNNTESDNKDQDPYAYCYYCGKRAEYLDVGESNRNWFTIGVCKEHSFKGLSS